MDPDQVQERVLFAMVGLPARGKSFISGKLQGFLNWIGLPTETFNAGRARRENLGASDSGRADFFSGDNASAAQQREQIAMAVLDQALAYLGGERGRVAIFDATNTTAARRRAVAERVAGRATLVFLESVCGKPEVLRDNMRQKVRQSPDFAGVDEEAALADLQARVAKYESVYEPLGDDEGLAYIKIIDLAAKVICFQLQGRLSLTAATLMMCSNVSKRPIYLCRSGHSPNISVEALQKACLASFKRKHGALPGAEDVNSGPYAERQKRLRTEAGAVAGPGAEAEGAGLFDSDVELPSAATASAGLSEAGRRFGRRLVAYLSAQEHGLGQLHCFTSTLPRAVETLAALPAGCRRPAKVPSLGPLNTGVCHGMKLSEIHEQLPEEVARWKRDPFRYRYPGGESIQDLNRRLTNVLFDIERIKEPVLVVSHLATIQSLLSYFRALPVEQTPFLQVPEHAVLVLTPSNYGYALKVVEEPELPSI